MRADCTYMNKSQSVSIITWLLLKQSNLSISFWKNWVGGVGLHSLAMVRLREEIFLQGFRFNWKQFQLKIQFTVDYWRLIGLFGFNRILYFNYGNTNNPSFQLVFDHLINHIAPSFTIAMNHSIECHSMPGNDNVIFISLKARPQIKMDKLPHNSKRITITSDVMAALFQ